MKKMTHFKSIISLGLPLMLGSILQILMGTMDVYFISQLGTEFTAASSMGTSIAGVFFIFSMLVSAGAIALVARKIGEKDYDAVRSYGVTAIMMAGVIGLGLSLLSLAFSESIIQVYDPDPSLAGIIKDYVQIIFTFIFIVFLNTTLRSIVQSTGNTRGPLLVFGTANIINIVLDYLFIMELGMGIKGAATATVISQIVACLIMFVLFYRQLFDSPKDLLKLIRIRAKEVKDIFAIGIWACIQSIARPITGLIMMRSVYSVGGKSGSAAFGIGLNIINYFFIVLTGLSGAISILVGQKIGEKNIVEAKAIVKEGILYSLVNYLLFAIPYLLLTEMLFQPFNAAPEVAEMGVDYVRIVFVGFLVLGHVFMYRGAFAGAGDTYPPMVAALFANVVCKLSLAIIFTSVLKMGIEGVWYAILVSIFAEFLVVTTYYKKDKLYSIKID